MSQDQVSGSDLNNQWAIGALLELGVAAVECRLPGTHVGASKEPGSYIGVIGMPLFGRFQVCGFKNNHASGHVAFGIEEWTAKANASGLMAISEVGIAGGEAQCERVFLVDGGYAEQHGEGFLVR